MFMEELDSLEEEAQDPSDLARSLQERGINVRYLGRIASEAYYNHVRETGVIEIIARCMKNVIRDGMILM
jgi:hypothetical protein